MKLKSWSEMFPEGRTLFYEGDDPEGFCKEMISKFAFDPSKDNSEWGRYISPSSEFGHDGFVSYVFHCPPELIDGIYNDKYPLGS